VHWGQWKHTISIDGTIVIEHSLQAKNSFEINDGTHRRFALFESPINWLAWAKLNWAKIIQCRLTVDARVLYSE
jgi:hypothetical protein